MSLRRKIIFLFFVFAIVPLLGLAGFSYWHAQNLLKGVVQNQLLEVAEALRADLAAAEAGINGRLEALSGSQFSGLSPSGDSPNPAALFLGDSLLQRAAFVGFRREMGSLALLAGSLPQDRVQCDGETGSRLVSFSTPIFQNGEPGALEAAFWISDLVPLQTIGKDRTVSVVDGEGNSLYSSHGCPLLSSGIGWKDAAGIDPAQRSSGPIDSPQFTVGDGPELGAYSTLLARDWTVLVTMPLSRFLGPIRQLILFYWLFVLALGISTALAFSIIIRRYTMSLSELVRAAEEIGLGELDPWLPLPSSGELGQLTLAFSRMLERIRRMMSQVDQSGRLAVVGQLSAYLAHEIRNPLSSIKLNLQRLLRWTRSGRLPEYCLEPLEISIKEVERLNASVSGVLQLAKAEDSPQEVVRLHQVLSEAADLVGSRFRRQGVALSLGLDAEADLVYARAGQLKSAVLNLMVNALEAQPHGGRLEVLTALVQTPDGGPPAISLHFRDEGPGVPSDIRDRIFEPFFTTKTGGAGIGLAMAKQAVEENGGQLILEPSFGKDAGAEFVVILPLASSESGDMAHGPSGASLEFPSTRPYYPASTRTEFGLAQTTATPEHLPSPGRRHGVLSHANPEPEEML